MDGCAQIPMRSKKISLAKPGNYLFRGKGIIPHVELSINCRLGCLKNNGK
jgi:hypothetical protein